MGKLKLVFVIILVMGLAACGQSTPNSEAQPTGSSLPTAPVSPISPISPLPSPKPESDAETQDLAALRAGVAEQLGMPATALTLISAEEMIWPDASLGCPQPDMMYAQVLTPGWRMVFKDTNGTEYQVHTTEDRKDFVVCESSAESLVPPVGRDDPTVQAAIKTLAEQEGVEAESVTVVSVSAIEWRNSCLGCEQPGQQCLMVITPGYRITLQIGAETYNLHTDRTGRQAIICTQSNLTPPLSDS
jgi:hypothetical protein